MGSAVGGLLLIIFFRELLKNASISNLPGLDFGGECADS